MAATSDDIERGVRINTGLREAVYAALSFIPGVGGVLGAITNTLWPNGPEISTWETVRKDVEKLAGDLINKDRANELQAELEGFHDQYDLYIKAAEITGRQIHFESLRGDVARESSRYCRDTAPWETLPYFVGMCTFRLSIEKYYIDHYSELYKDSSHANKKEQEEDLSDLVDKFILAAGKARQHCVEWRQNMVEEVGGDLPSVVDTLAPGWQFHSRNNAERSLVMARRREYVAAEYGAKIDAILTPSQMWIWYKPSMAPQLLAHPMNGGPMMNWDRWGRKTVYDEIGPFPNLPKRALQTGAVSFDDRAIMETYCFSWNETIMSITWWTENVFSIVPPVKLGERVVGIKVVYGRWFGGTQQEYPAELRGKETAGRNTNKYTISIPTPGEGFNTRDTWISEAQIVCGDNANKAPIEALAFTWKDIDNKILKEVGQHEFINSLAPDRVGRNVLKAPRTSVTELGNRFYFDPPRLAYISGSHIPGVGLVSLKFHWRINQYD